MVEQITPAMSKAFKDAFDEWQRIEEKNEQNKVRQSDIIESVAAVLEASKSDVAWAFKTYHKGNKEEIEERLEERDTLYSML